jgi:hypothetical protein
MEESVCEIRSNYWGIYTVMRDNLIFFEIFLAKMIKMSSFYISNG